MKRAIFVFTLCLLSVAVQDLAGDATVEKDWALDLIAPDRDVGHLRDKCLAESSTSAEIKHAIEERLVIPGMCPLEAFAAVGLPRSYAIFGHNDKSRLFSPAVITAQCEHPNANVAIELLFRNDTQFHTPKPVLFRVRFETGRAVFVDRELRLGRPRSEL